MSSAFVSYLDLKDQNKPLPPRAKFVDSYDDAVYHVVKGETLDQFTARIVKSREEKGFPPFDPADLRAYIVTCLAETTDKTELGNYFVKKTNLPEFSKAITLAKTIVQNRLSSNESSFELRQSRASACASCPLNVRNSAPVPKTIVNSIEKFIKLDQILLSDTEKQLGSCAMCGCDLKTKIRLSLTGAIAALTPDEIRVALLKVGSKLIGNCWILSESIKDEKLKKVVEAKVRNSGPHTQDMIYSYYAQESERLKQSGKA